MRQILAHFVSWALGLGALAVAASTPAAAAGHELPDVVKEFAARKEDQARRLAAKLDTRLSAELWAYFDAAKAGDAVKARAVWDDLFKRKAAGVDRAPADPVLDTPLWHGAADLQLVVEQFAQGEPTYLEAFGRDIVKSLPPGSVYFGGTDAGRGLVTLFSRAPESGDPCFIIGQNALTDGTYLGYLRLIYGDQLTLPGEKEAAQAVQQYLDDARRRHEHDQRFPDEPPQIRSGEEVRVVDGGVRVSGTTAITAINALLARFIFERNPARAFYVEESFPLDWMSPHAVPHGLVLKLERVPVATLTADQIRKDQAFWAGHLEQKVGGWLEPETPVATLGAFAERVFLRRDLSGFAGDPRYIANPPTGLIYAKLRSAGAELYAWRADRAASAADKERFGAAADYACRQAFALSPRSPEAAFRYAHFLIARGRFDDAVVIARTAGRVNNGAPVFAVLLEEIEAARKAAAK